MSMPQEISGKQTVTRRCPCFFSAHQYPTKFASSFHSNPIRVRQPHRMPASVIHSAFGRLARQRERVLATQVRIRPEVTRTAFFSCPGRTSWYPPTSSVGLRNPTTPLCCRRRRVGRIIQADSTHHPSGSQMSSQGQRSGMIAALAGAHTVSDGCEHRPSGVLCIPPPCGHFRCSKISGLVILTTRPASSSSTCPPYRPSVRTATHRHVPTLARNGRFRLRSNEIIWNPPVRH